MSKRENKEQITDQKWERGREREKKKIGQRMSSRGNNGSSDGVWPGVCTGEWATKTEWAICPLLTSILEKRKVKKEKCSK